MYIKLAKILLKIFLVLIPFGAFSEQVETKISADIVTAKPNGVLYAQGNVTVQYGRVYAKAKSLSFNQAVP